MSEPIKLNLWVMPNAGFDTQRILQRELADFQKMNPDYAVRLTVIPWFFAWDRLTAVAKKRLPQEPPDVIQIGGTWTTTLAALGAVCDVTDYLDDIERNDIIRPLWNYSYEPSRTKAYSLPWFTDTRVLYYRRDLLNQLGLKPEDVGTWSGLREACERLRDHPKLGKNYFGLALPGQREGILIHDLAPWVWGAGGTFLSADRQNPQFNKPAALQGIHFFYQMMVDHLVPLLGRDRLVTGNFFSGQAAFQVSGVWPVNSTFNPRHPAYQPDVAKNYGISLFPSGPAGQVTYLGGSNLAITSISQHPEGAWKLIKFLIDPASQVRHSRQIGMLPSRYSALEKLLTGAPAHITDVFRQSLRVARTLPCAATLGTIERILGNVSQRLITAVCENRYSERLLGEEMAQASKEADYILSLYE
jgi:multiple sugar transport system substrate-binding protein